MQDLINVEDKNQLLAAFSTDGGIDPLIEQVKTLVESFEHDLSTAAGRKKTASLAAKVASFKVKVDGMGKDLVKDWKEKSKRVDVNRKAVRDQLDALKAEARKPLTDWEDEQAAERQAILEKARAEKLQAELDDAHEMALLMDEKIERERADEIERQRLETEQREAQLKKEAAEAAKKATEDKAAAELWKSQEAQRKAEAAAAESERKAVEAKAAAEAAEEAQRVAAANAEAERKEAVKQAEINEKQRQIDEQNAIKEAEAERQRNIEHVRKINRAAMAALVAEGIAEEDCKKVILAIYKKKIPNVSIKY